MVNDLLSYRCRSLTGDVFSDRRGSRDRKKEPIGSGWLSGRVSFSAHTTGHVALDSSRG